MATTSAFGWETPDDTDLVKDGAAAIRTLGNSIDTSMAELKGGTSGQVLSKASNTDMDFTWITNDQGDITGVTAGTGLTGGGTSGAVTVSLDVANFGGGQFAAGKNYLINGDFNINQRNFSSSTANGYGFDRWTLLYGSGSSATYSAQTFTAGAAPVAGYEGKNFARMAVTTTSNVNEYAILEQKIEDVRTLAGKTVTVSFWAKAASGTPKVGVEFYQAFGTGGSADNSSGGTAVTISTSWARYSVTINVPSISGKTVGTGSLTELNLWCTAGSGFNTRSGSIGNQSATIDFWGVQVENGSTATPFQTATGTIQGELAACQRYYWRQNAPTTSTVFGQGWSSSTTVAKLQTSAPVTMRTAPTSVDYANLQLWDGGATYTISSFGLEYTNQNTIGLSAGSSSMTAYRPCAILSTSTSGYLGFSAEL